MDRRSDIVGMKELEKGFKKLGKVPQTVATKSAKSGAQIAFKASKQNAPVDEGNLKSGLIMKPERRVKVGKKVYDIMLDPSKNDLFVKTSAAGKRSYYPASQEYGYMTADGGYVPGYRYLRKAMTENARVMENKMVEVAGKAVDKALNAR